MAPTAPTSLPARRVFYLSNPSGDIGHAVHLLRLLAELKKRRGGRSLIFLRAPAIYPYAELAEYGEVFPLPAAPSAASGRRLASRIKAFRPSAVVTEFFPFGRTECLPELAPALEAASALGARLYASVPMPYFTAPESGLAGLLRACASYDKILVHSPGVDLSYMARAVSLERRVAPAAFLSVFRELGRKVVFTGYLAPEALPPKPAREEGFVLVTRGGGSTSDNFFEAAIKASALCGRPFLLVAGPATPPVKLAFFRRLAAAAGGGARVLGVSAELPALTARAALCLSTAGGCVYEMLALRKKMVLAPYCGARGREHSDQLARAWLMRDLAGAAVLLPADLTPAKIAAAVGARLNKPLRLSPRVKPVWFGGAKKAAGIIGGAR